MDGHGLVTSRHCRLPGDHNYTNLCIAADWGTSELLRTVPGADSSRKLALNDCAEKQPLSGLDRPPQATSLSLFLIPESQGFCTWIIVDQSWPRIIKVRICSKHENRQRKTFTSTSIKCPCLDSAFVCVTEQVGIERNTQNIFLSSYRRRLCDPWRAIRVVTQI